MPSDIQLIGGTIWPVSESWETLGTLRRMEIATWPHDHIRIGKWTAFEYAKKRGTRNMMDPPRPILSDPRGATDVSARWDREALSLCITCHGQETVSDEVIIVIAANDDGSVELSVGRDGSLPPSSAATAKIDVIEQGWSASIDIPWSTLGLRPWHGMMIGFNVVRYAVWPDVLPPKMAKGGKLLSEFGEVPPGLEVSTFSRDVRLPVQSDPTGLDRLGAVVLSPRMVVDNITLENVGLASKRLHFLTTPRTELPEDLDVTIVLTDPFGRKAHYSAIVSSRGEASIELNYAFVANRGYLWPYILDIQFTDPHTGAPLFTPHMRFFAENDATLTPLSASHQQRHPARFRIEGKVLDGSSWEMFIVNTRGEESARGALEVTESPQVFSMPVGEVMRGRHRIRLRPQNVHPSCYLEAPCWVTGHRQRPSVLLKREDLPSLRKSVRMPPLAPYYEEIKEFVDKSLAEGVIVETRVTESGLEEHRISFPSAPGEEDDLLLQGMASDSLFLRNPQLLMNAALVGLVEDDSHYIAAAIDLLDFYMRRILWGDPRVYGADPDHIWKAMYGAIVYDWLYEHIEPEQRERLRRNILQNGLRLYTWAMLHDAAYWKGTFENLNPIANSAAAITALVLQGEELEAEEALEIAREDIQCAAQAQPPDGSWPESINYWGVYMQGLTDFAAAMRSVLGTDDGILAQPGMREAPLFPMYFYPRGVPMGFNDGMNSAAEPFLHLLAEHFNNPLFSAFADAYAGTDERMLCPDYRTLLWRSSKFDKVSRASRTPVGDAPPPQDLANQMKLETLKVYEEIGWAAITSSWPTPELYLSFKSGYAKPGFGHFNQDLNAVRVLVEGEPLVSSSHAYGTPPHGFSNLLVNEQPQGQSCGQFLKWQETQRVKWIVAEADEAFAPIVSQWRRHALMIDGRYLILVDELRATEPVSVTFQIHTPANASLADGLPVIAGNQAMLAVCFVSEKPNQIWIDEEPPHALLSRNILRATFGPTDSFVLPVVLWPGTEAVPYTTFDEQTLEIRPPTGDCLKLKFITTDDGTLTLQSAGFPNTLPPREGIHDRFEEYTNSNKRNRNR